MTSAVTVQPALLSQEIEVLCSREQDHWLPILPSMQLTEVPTCGSVQLDIKI